MRVKIVKYNNDNCIMIYISQEESNNKETTHKIEEYKKECKHVSIFLSGNTKAEEILKTIVKSYEEAS